jgi:hypothetical protein
MSNQEPENKEQIATKYSDYEVIKKKYLDEIDRLKKENDYLNGKIAKRDEEELAMKKKFDEEKSTILKERDDEKIKRIEAENERRSQMKMVEGRLEPELTPEERNIKNTLETMDRVFEKKTSK